MGTVLAIVALIIGAGLVAGAARGRPAGSHHGEPPRSLRVLHKGMGAPNALVTKVAKAGAAIGANPKLLWLVAGAVLAVALAPAAVLTGIGLLVAGWYAVVLSAYGYLSLAEHHLGSTRATKSGRKHAHTAHR